MRGLRSQLKMAFCALLAGVTGVGVLATPASAAMPSSPGCSVRAAGMDLAEGSCVNGSPLWNYRIRIYCTWDLTNGTPDSSVQSEWRKTTEPIVLACSWGGAGYYTNIYDVELRFLAA